MNQNPPSLSQLLVLHVNIRSLPKNFDSLTLLINNLSIKPHIILISETWLDPSLSRSYNLDNYHLETSSHPEFRGKGAAIYIRKSLAYGRRGDLESNTQQFQSVFVEFKGACNKIVIIGTIYRSPSFSPLEFIEYLDPTLEKVNDEHKLCVIGGDFNIDILKHNSMDTCSNFIYSLASAGFFPCISLPTRITPQSATLIDNCFCNDPSLVESSKLCLFGEHGGKEQNIEEQCHQQRGGTEGRMNYSECHLYIEGTGGDLR